MPLLLLLACKASFWGDAERVEFETDIGFGQALNSGPGPSVPWSSRDGIAVQTTFALTATGWVDSSYYVHEYGPLASASTSDSDILTIEEVGPDSWSCAAVGEGQASAEFQGDADDILTVLVHAPVEVALVDPAPVSIAFLLDEVAGFALLAGTPPDPVLRRLAIYEEGALDLWAAPVSAEGEPLFHRSDDLGMEASDCASREAGDDAIELNACNSSVALSFGDTASSVAISTVASDAEVASLELVVADLGDAQGYAGFNLVAWAVAYLEDGTRALQLPCEWTAPAGLELRPLDDPSFPEPRTDLVGIVVTDRPFGELMSDDIAVQCLTSNASATVSWIRLETAFQTKPVEQASVDGSNGGGCLCSTASSAGSISLTWILVAGIARRRRLTPPRD